jgi:Bacterial Ig-like domain/WD40-like Beta Propeller Repeat
MLLALGCGALSGCFASPPQIIALDPSRGSVGVPADTPIVVQFDRSVVRQSVEGRFSVSPQISNCDLAAAFTAGPAAACRIAWLSGDTGFSLQHQHAVLDSNTRYTFTLAGGFADPEGAVNTVDHRWDVTTAAAPEVRSISPAQGATGVPADLPLAVSFSTAMALASTRDAITLSPAIPGTRVERNSRDRTRFLVLPGRPLQSGVSYRLNVGTGATDEHGQGLAVSTGVSFTAGGLSPAGHAVILAGLPGQAASEVLVAAVGSAAPGDPLAAETMLTSPVCPAAGACGSVEKGGPIYTFTAAALSQNGAWLAAVENDRTSPDAAPSVVVLNAATGAVVTVVPNATLPSWSPDSSTLAYAEGGSVALYRPTGGTTTVLPPGDPLLAPPVWEPRGELLVLDSGSSSGLAHLELADALVGARYPVPGLTGQNTGPVVSPDGTQLAVYRIGPTDTGVWLAGIGANANAPRLLDSDIQPFGWTDPGTLLAIAGSAAGHPTLVEVSVAGGGAISVTPAPSAAALASVSLSSSGRLFAFLSLDAQGLSQVDIQSVEGGSVVPVTSFAAGGDVAKAVSLS